jgi:hypothetical protein
MTDDKKIHQVLEGAQHWFGDRLQRLQESGLSREQYVRFLTMQYHLTKGVQRPFMLMASHSCFTKRPKMRAFLFRFAEEEELHFKIAQKDLENLGAEPGPCPLEVEAWWAFFEPYLTRDPFVRLGATIILENLTVGSRDILDRVLAKSTFLNAKNTKFLQIHRHEELPHGDQILDALRDCEPTPEERASIGRGAEVGALFYSRILAWVLDGESRLAA